MELDLELLSTSTSAMIANCINKDAKKELIKHQNTIKLMMDSLPTHGGLIHKFILILKDERDELKKIKMRHALNYADSGDKTYKDWYEMTKNSLDRLDTINGKLVDLID